MFFKKWILMVSLAVVTVLSVPSFANAEESKDLLLGRFYETDVRNGIQRYDLNGSFMVERYYIRGTNNSASSGYMSVRLLDSNNKLIWSSIDYKLEYPRPSDKGNTYSGTFPNPYPNIRYVELKGSGKIFDFSVFGKEYIPEITNLKEKVESTKITFNWENPISEKVVAVNLYQDKKRIQTFGMKDNVTSYVVEGLKQGKKYDFTFKSVDKEGRETTGISKQISIDAPLLDPPKSVYVTPQNESLIINWESVNPEFLKGYNVYVDGKKVNDELLTSNKLILKNMENDKKYSVQVSAVNSQGKEGNKSGAVIESPSKDATTIDYDVKVPMTGVELLKTAGTIVLWLSPFILLGIAVIWFKPLRRLIVKAVLDHKKKGEKK
ncbi:fibronectin type III domain-containing protein [Bacillus cereus]|uniref:fibronectin type III domain-containing protein n=1 Tax=Bacillus cereus TaxID=1396 RepID=UPI001F1078F9|nr:fibronectin type III domain-containing protein [Bacillus cereus]